MKKVVIKNSKGLKLVILPEINPKQKGLAFVMHGQGGFKEQSHIQAIADAFKKFNYSVVRFDTTCSLRESGGDISDVSITQSHADLEDVVKWAEKQKWYQSPFALAGHSLGGICTALFAKKNPEKVKLLAPISTVVSGKLIKEAYSKKEIEEWERKGYRIEMSKSKPGVQKRIKWSSYTDWQKYDLLINAGRLTMPVLFAAGEFDTSTPPRHQKLLFDKIKGKKEFHIIKGSPHTFRKTNHLKEIRQIFDRWLKKYA